MSRLLVKYFINLNSYNAKLYNLKRSKQYENLEADATDAAIMADMQREQQEKEQLKEEKLQDKKRNKAARRSKNKEGGEPA